MSKVKVKVPPLSGFDKSFQNLLTSKVGTITPILIDEVIPNTKVDLRTVISASLPPLASDTFMRCNLKVEAFFVPMRLLYGGFEDWLTSQKRFHTDDQIDYRVSIPWAMAELLSGESLSEQDFAKPGSLADYLGCRASDLTLEQDTILRFNILPFLCYHRVFDDWYRNSLIQKPLFHRPFGADSTGLLSISALPFVSYSEDDDMSFNIYSRFDDGVQLCDLRQRNFGADFFTTALPDAQLGDAKRVEIVTPSGGTAGFTIAALRMANSLQQFAERNQMAGPRLQDYVRANYGADLSSGVAQRSIVLGSGEISVYSKGVYSQANNEAALNQNPFGNSVGAEYGSAQCAGELNLIHDFTAQEPGYILVNATLVPRVTYSSGIHPMLTRYTDGVASNVEMATPLLENTGFEAIRMMELTGKPGQVDTFGYVQRYANFKKRYDELHGLLRDGQSLESFALQRTIDGSPTISSEFLQIPTDYLDQVAAVKGDISKYGVWIDCFHSYRTAMPLSEYAIPTLQDPAYEHGHEVSIEIGGSQV